MKEQIFGFVAKNSENIKLLGAFKWWEFVIITVAVSGLFLAIAALYDWWSRWEKWQ